MQHYNFSLFYRWCFEGKKVQETQLRRRSLQYSSSLLRSCSPVIFTFLQWDYKKSENLHDHSWQILANRKTKNGKDHSLPIQEYIWTSAQGSFRQQLKNHKDWRKLNDQCKEAYLMGILSKLLLQMPIYHLLISNWFPVLPACSIFRRDYLPLVQLLQRQ